MIVDRQTLREGTKMSDADIQRIMMLAYLHRTVCDYGERMGHRKNGYISSVGCFDIEKLYAFLKAREVAPNIQKRVDIAVQRIGRVLECLRNLQQ